VEKILKVAPVIWVGTLVEKSPFVLGQGTSWWKHCTGPSSV